MEALVPASAVNVDMDTGGNTTGGCHDSSSSSANPIFEPTGMILGNRENRGSNIDCTSNNGNIHRTAAAATTTTVTPNSNSKRRAMMRMKRSRRKPGTAGGRLGGRRQRRLWQLPKSSIDEYTKWIQDKPEEDRTPNEQRFLWKCMIRSLGVVSGPAEMNAKRSRQERIREFVDRLEAKEPMELTEMEELFVQLYHKRRKDRKANKQRKQQQQQQQKEDEMTVSWMRGDGNNNTGSTSFNFESINWKNKNKNKGFEPQASLESLRESMNRMGLSSDKLKHVRFADQTTE